MQAPTSTFGLLERIKAGEREAFDQLFVRYRPRLAVLIHYKLSPELRRTAEVDDVLQETLLRAWRDLERFEYRTPGSFLRWLASIADHVIIDAARAQARQCRAGVQVPFRSESNPRGPEPADSRTPSRVLAEHQAVEALLARLDALPGDYRQAILLSKIEGLSTAEMAERLGRSREAASLLLHRAVKRFRELAG